MIESKNKIFKVCLITLATFALFFIINLEFTNKAEAATNESNTKQVSTSASQMPSYYKKTIPLSFNLQKYLYDLCVKRGLDYKETLAVIRHESSFNPRAKGGNNYGYFQVSKVNHANLAKTLKTKNAPFDPYINMNWGTYMLSNLQNKYKKYGLKGSNLKAAVLSAYNKGEGGYARTGKATAYIKRHNQHLAYIKAQYK